MRPPKRGWQARSRSTALTSAAMSVQQTPGRIASIAVFWRTAAVIDALSLPYASAAVEH